MELRILTISLFLALCAGCSGDVSIGHGYDLFKGDQGFAIIHDRIVVVDPDVRKYKYLARRFVMRPISGTIG